MQEDYENEFGDNFEFPSQSGNGDDENYSDFEDSFADLIPSDQQGGTASSIQAQSPAGEDPFSDLVPKNAPNGTTNSDSYNTPKKSVLDKIVDPVIAAGDAANKGLRHAIAAPAQFINPFIDQATKGSLNTNLTGDLNAWNKRLDEEYKQKHPDAGITEQTISNVTEGLPALLAGGAGVPALASKGIGGLANLALSGAASAPLIYDESGELNPLQKTAIGGATGSGIYGLNRLAPLAGKAFNKLAGEISEPELREAIEANKGLKTGIGDIINSPALKTIQENGLAHFPFSGVENTQIKTARKLTDEGNGILSNLLGAEEKNAIAEGGTIDVGATLQKSLKSLEEGLSNEKRSLYNNVDEIAEKSGVKISGDNYKKEAKALLENMRSSREFGDLDNTDKAAFKKYLQDISKTNGGSLKSANLKISDLSESAQKEFISSNKFLGGAYNKLKTALQKDLRSSIDSSGNEELKSTYEKAQRHYAENIAPFEDKDILKFTRKGADSDTLVNHFLKTGKNDRGNLLGKLVDKLNPQERNALAYDYFRPAFKDSINGKELIPRKMVQLYNKLGTKTKEKLFSPDFREQMKRYGVRVNKNSSAFDAMHNPKTGRQLGDILKIGELASAGTALLMGHPAFATALGVASGTANLANRGLNSEWLRNLYLKGYKPLRSVSPIEGGLAAEAQDLKNQY